MKITTENKYLNALIYFAIFYIAIPFVSSIPPIIFNGGGMFGVPITTLIVYILFYFIIKPDKKVYTGGMFVNGIALLVLTVIFTAMLYKAEGNIESLLMGKFDFLLLPFLPSMIALGIMEETEAFYIAVFASFIIGFIFCAILSRSKKVLYFIVPALCISLCANTCIGLYENRPQVRYSGHGFDYMNGDSSTDFTDYTVYAENSKLVTLNHKSPIIIENEKDMPVLDGAEACYPLYSAFAKAVYKDIDIIEKNSCNDEEYEYSNGKIVTFTNTINGFYRLVNKENLDSKCDMFFGAKPSEDQLSLAKENGVEVEITPIGREAFVFFVEEDNPVDNLTSDDIRKIYHGDIVNWKELGGKDEEIVAFQRPENSGSQTMMQYFMNGISLKEPKQYETVSAMEGVITEVAQYNNEAGAIGYTFRYFLEGLHQ